MLVRMIAGAFDESSQSCCEGAILPTYSDYIIIGDIEHEN